MSWARRTALQSFMVCIVLLVVMICVWGTEHLLLCAALAVGGAVLLFMLRAGRLVYRVLDEAQDDLLSSPFRIPMQDSDTPRP